MLFFGFLLSTVLLLKGRARRHTHGTTERIPNNKTYVYFLDMRQDIHDQPLWWEHPLPKPCERGVGACQTNDQTSALLLLHSTKLSTYWIEFHPPLWSRTCCSPRTACMLHMAQNTNREKNQSQKSLLPSAKKTSSAAHSTEMAVRRGFGSWQHSGGTTAEGRHQLGTERTSTETSDLL